jgi:hypothetical protein
VVFERLRGQKQHAVVPILPQQSPHSVQDSGIIIDDKNEVPIWHERQLASGMLDRPLG